MGAIGSNLDVREIAATENEIGLAQASRLQGENASSADVTITRADPRGSVSVDYATADDSAKAGRGGGHDHRQAHGAHDGHGAAALRSPTVL